MYQLLGKRLNSFVKYVVFNDEKVCPGLCHRLTPINVRSSSLQANSSRVMVSPSSFFRLLSFPGIGWSRSADRKTGQIRTVMLSLLQVHTGQNVQRLMQRVRFAEDVEALWYLRQDLLAAISEVDGELEARRQVKQINGMFKGGLPNTMGPRIHQRFPV
ncbi:hypothetical protein [Variovorax sp. RTB1]|jgi:hypothetical protein|uniref:hypothetical protein n=1 Tax=Variovorax sp. RTB1 TaxID=3048631 RepID=UPI002B2370C3|nr:hypothetical protein [Variovorax sp. RTB1]